MPDFYHSSTDLSREKVLKNPKFLDWNTQPKGVKEYPSFYPKVYFHDALESYLSLTYCNFINYTKSYGLSLYTLRTTPSAGALYPYEVYIQIKNVVGFENGIYHLDPQKGCLTTLKLLNKDEGVEVFFDQREKEGFLFLISSNYFRSSWKYDNRSFRYLFLDNGHVLGNIEAIGRLVDKKVDFYFSFDKISLNRYFGFEDKEFFTVAAHIGNNAKEIQTLHGPLPFVLGTDYFEPNAFVYESYMKTLQKESLTLSCEGSYADITQDKLESMILSRRSARGFRQETLTFESVRRVLGQVLEHSLEGLEIYYAVYCIDSMQIGLYKEKALIREGDFSLKCASLGLDQKLLSDANITFFITAKLNDYQKQVQLAGLLGHRIYLYAANESLGCSGIGAYYDDEVKEFLGTKNEILYLLCVGR